MAANRIALPDDYDPIADAIHRLHLAGWLVGDVAFHDGAGGLLWVVSGHNRENLIPSEGRTAVQAWEAAVEQAMAVGMLSREKLFHTLSPQPAHAESRDDDGQPFPSESKPNRAS